MAYWNRHKRYAKQLMIKSALRLQYVAALQAALGLGLALAVAIKLFVLNGSPQNATHLMVVGLLGLVAVAFFATIHFALKADKRMWSSFALIGLNSATLAYLTLATGGIDSPYYTLWLGQLVIAGLVSPIASGIMLAVSVAWHGLVIATSADAAGSLAAHFGQLAITFGAAGLAEWIRRGMGNSTNQKQQVEELSGQLKGEAIKSEAIMQSVAEGVMAVDSDRHIQLFNAAATTITGWDAKSAQGIDYRLVLGLQDPQGNKLDDINDPFVQSWRDKKNLVRDDLIMQTKGGHRINIMMSISPMIGPDGQPNGGIALFRDISADKEVERLRDEFISTASHEMRTPVAAIEGYLSLSMNPAVATIDQRAKGYLEKAHSSTKHLGELFRDLLSITKLEDNPKNDKREAVELTKVIKEVVSDMQFSAQAKSLELQFMPTASAKGEKTITPLFGVMGNEQRLREVTMNLVENAIKFTPKGRVSVALHGDKDSVTVEISDSGVGIAPEDAAHLFQKFYRIDNSATRTIGGTGLGLYLCRSIIELYGGRIWVESKMGEGSTFKFTLPRISSDELAKAQAAREAAEQAPAAPAPATDKPVTPATPSQPVAGS